MPLVALAAASFGSSALAAWSQYQQGQEANNAAIRQAQSLQEQAKQVKFNTGAEIGVNDYKAIHIISRMQAVVAASGIDPQSGSPELETVDSAEEAKLNDQYAAYAGQIASQNLTYEAGLTKVAGKEAESAANIGASTGLISGAIDSAGLSGVGKPGGFGGTGWGAYNP